MADLIGTYQFDLNRAMPLTGVDSTLKMSRAVIWTLVHQLIDAFGAGLTGAWEHVYSSTGSAHSTAVNQWWNGGTFDSALMPNTSDVTTDPLVRTDLKAMFAIRPRAGAPGAAFGTNRPTLLFVHSHNGGASDWGWLVYVTNGVLSAPAAVGRFPVTTTAWSGTWTGVNYEEGWLFALPSASEYVTRKCHLVLATDGAFFWGAHKTGTQRMFNGFACLPLEQPVAGDAAPWMFWHGGPTPSSGDEVQQWPSTNYYTGKSAWGAGRWIGNGWLNGSLMTAGAAPGGAVRGINYPGSTAASYTPAFPIALWSSWKGEAYNRLITRGGKDPYRQTWPEFPVWLLDSSNCVRGYPRDLWLCYAQPNEGDVSPGGTVPVTRMNWGDFWIPSPDSVTPISW